MKRSSLALIFILFSIVSIFSQVPNDPNDPLYRDLERWYERGYITRLPPVRPYPLQLLVELLEEVEEMGTVVEREAAAYYKKNIGGDLSVHPSALLGVRTSSDGPFSETGGGFVASGFLLPSVSASARLNVTADLLDKGFVLPAYTAEPADHNSDWADFTLFSQKFFVRQSLVSNVAFGNYSAYFQAGIQRTSFGPFFRSGGIVDSSAPHSGHFSFTWNHPSFTYTALLLELTASLDSGTGIYPDKHFFLHSISFYPAPWLDVGFFESVVWGGRFDLIYLMPLKELFYVQSITGLLDNSLFGMTFDLRPGADTRLSLALNIDDMHFNDLVSFKFDTKYKVALQYGASWSPSFLWLERLAFSHQLVMPYMYTHRNETNRDGANYLNYTHMGKNLGSSLPPNSERYSLEYSVHPVSPLEVTITGDIIRHGNASVGYDIPNGDGSLFDSGWDSSGNPTFQGHTRFLEQKVIERTWQAGLDASYLFTGFTAFAVRGGIGYTFEYRENAGLAEGKTTSNNYFRLGLSVTF